MLRRNRDVHRRSSKLLVVLQSSFEARWSRRLTVLSANFFLAFRFRLLDVRCTFSLGLRLLLQLLRLLPASGRGEAAANLRGYNPPPIRLILLK